MRRFTKIHATIATLAAAAGLLLTGCPLDQYNGHAEAGRYTVEISAEGWEGLPGSQLATNDGDGDFLEWQAYVDEEGGAWPEGMVAWGLTNSTHYTVESVFGSPWGDLEGAEFYLYMGEYQGPGDFYNYADRLDFVWRGDRDPETGEQRTFAIRGQPEGDCTIVVDDNTYSGSIECTGLKATVDGVEWKGAPFTLTATWNADNQTAS